MKVKLTIQRPLAARFLSLPFVPLLVMAMTFFPAGRVDAAEIFLKLGSGAGLLPGESRDPVFKGDDGWNDVSFFEWKVTADSSWIKGGGASIGRPVPEAVEITRRIDSASPAILAAILTGDSIPTGELVIRDTSRLADRALADTS